jgi:hypothetical protein
LNRILDTHSLSCTNPVGQQKGQETMKRRLIVLTVIALGVLSACRSRENLSDISSWSAPSADPVLTVGHGAIIDAQGREINPTPEFALNAQRFYVKKLYDQAQQAQRDELRAKLHRVQEVKGLTPQERIFVNGAAIEWLVDTVKPFDAPYLLAKNNALRSRIFAATAAETAIAPALLDRLTQEGLIKTLSATTNAGGAYLEECRRAGVPTPPDWGSPAWQSRGMLPFKFIIQAQDAEVFAFESNLPRGMCLALPRSSGNSISALGIICLGTETSNACYWDNWSVQAKKPFPITKGSNVPILQFAAGADLLNGNGVCTDCHAGENPYVVHPGTPLDLGAKIIPKTWFDPLVHPSWPQNDGPTNVLSGATLGPGDKSCLTCHASDRRFPDVSTKTPGYCGTILATAFSTPSPPGTMPPGDVANPKYAKHFNALKASCAQPPNEPIQVVINGATQSNPEPGRVDTGGPLGGCTDPNTCPPGFCYWTTLHGPFWQRTDSSIPIGDAKYRGSFVRIYADAGLWKWRAFSDPTGGPPNAPPGGTAECIAFNQIANVPNALMSGSGLWTIFDPKGTDFSSSVTMTAAGSSVNVLTGYIGNVAQSNDPTPDFLRVFDQSGKAVLAQNHSQTPLPPFQLGPLTGESWSNGSAGWTPTFAVTDVLSTSDVQLVAYPQSRDVRCFITGITGAWSSTRNSATIQPFAEIYVGPGKDIRLRVSPASDARDRVGAYASCIVYR